MEFVSEFERTFIEDGFVVIDDVVDQDLALSLKAGAIRNFEEALMFLQDNSLTLGIGIKNGFRDLVQRHPQRFEMPYKMDDPLFEMVLSSSIMSVVKAILGDDAVIINRSLVISMPEAKDQAWHTDGPHVNSLQYEPCHCLNLFVPLVEVNDLNGSTEFRPGSQFLTRDFAKQYLAAFVSKKLRPVVAPVLPVGSVLLFDYRVLHRGRANHTTAPRPILVFTFAKPWHSDKLNFPKLTMAQSAAALQSMLSQSNTADS